MAGTYWLTILPDTSKLKPAINAAMQGVKIKADFGVDEAKAKKAGRDAAKAAETEIGKSKPKLTPQADKAGADSAGQEAGRRVRTGFKKTADGHAAGREFGTGMTGGIKSSLGAIGPMLAGLGIGGALTASLREGMDFTTALNTMGAVSRATSDQLAQVSEKAKQLGSDAKLPGVSATIAATAMTELAKGGLTVSESMEAARGTLQLASAAGIDAATAATIQADALNTFGLGADKAGYAADVLANIANSSTGDITDFAQGFQQAGAVASQFGLKMDDTAAALGALANQGIKGSDAGTLIKSALLAITDTSNPAQGAIAELGLTLYDAQGNFVGMSSMMDQLGQAAKRMTPEMYQAATNTLFGSDAARLAGVAAKEGSTGFDQLKVAANLVGTAAETSEAKTRGLPGAWMNFQNAVDGVKLGVSEFLDGPLSGLLNSLSGLPAFVSRNSDAIKLLGAAIGTILVPAITLWIAAQVRALAVSIASGVGTIIGAWASIAAGIASATAAAATYVIVIARTVAASVLAGLSSMVTAFRNLAIGTRIAAVAQAAFNLVMMANPIGLIVAAIAAVVTGLVLFFTKTELGQKIWKGFTEYLKVAWEGIKAAFSAAWGVISGVWDSMVAKAGEVWEGIKSRFTAIVDFVKGLPSRIGDAAKGMWDGIGNAFKTMVDKLKGWWNGFASKLSFTSPDWLPGDPVKFSLPTFSKGGYTGSAAADQVAGVVHGGEHVIRASSRKRIENAYPGLLDFMNNTGRLPLPGYKGGGVVALGNISGTGITSDEQQSMWDAVRTKFPNAVLSSATREVMTEGHPDYHNAGRAIDISGPGMAQVAAWISKNFPDSLELIHSPFDGNIHKGKDVGDGYGLYGAGTMAAHQDHIHWALGRTANTDIGSESSAGSSSSSSSSGGSYRAATSSELSASSNRVSSAGKAVTQAQQRVDDKTFSRDRAQQRLDDARAAGKDTVDEERALEVANRELTDANTNLAEKRDKAADVEAADTELRDKGVLDSSSSSSTSSSTGGGDSSGSDFGKMFVSGLLESVGLDGSLFSNPLEWPSVKSAMAGVNYFGKLLAGTDSTATGGTPGGFAAGAADSVGLGGLVSALPGAQNGSPALAPGDLNPATGGGVAVAQRAGMSTFAPAPHQGSGQPPGTVDNSINLNGTFGYSKDEMMGDWQSRQNARTRTTVPPK